jgi:hypothetical protein
MSQPRFSNRETLCAIERAVEDAGATVAFEHGGIHIKAHITFGGRSRFVTVSSTPGQTHSLNLAVRDVRHTLRELGYVEPKSAPPAPTLRRRPQRKGGIARRKRPLPYVPHFTHNENNKMSAALQNWKARCPLRHFLR